MDFLNKCILNMFCREKCINYNNICDGIGFLKEGCTAENFIIFLEENNINISELAKQYKASR